MKKINIAFTIALILTSTIFLQRCDNDDSGRDGSVKPPQAASQVSHFKFNGNMKDAVGTRTPMDESVKNLTYTDDRFGHAEAAGDFDGTTTIVEIPGGDVYLADNDLTVSFWMKANSTKNGQFIMGLAGWKGFYFEISSDWSSIKLTTNYLSEEGANTPEDLFFAGTGLTKDNGGWQGYTFQEEVLAGVGEVYLKDKWVHVLTSYNAATRLNTMYLNGNKVMQTDFNLWPPDNAIRTTVGVSYAGNISGGGNDLALGFIQGNNNKIISESWADPADLFSNHFKGQLDDLRIFKKSLTETEVAILYKAEKL